MLKSSDISPKQRRQHIDNIASECHRFLGFMNYVNRFIPRYSELCFSLTNQTHLEPPQWTEECTRAWDQLKSFVSKATQIYHPDFTKPFHVYSARVFTQSGVYWPRCQIRGLRNGCGT